MGEAISSSNTDSHASVSMSLKHTESSDILHIATHRKF